MMMNIDEIIMVFDHEIAPIEHRMVMVGFIYLNAFL